MSLPLILVPGHMCGRWLYEPQIAALDGADIRLADVAQDDTVGAMAERLLASTPPRFALAGLSMGGMVAMEVMARAPERLAHVCLMNTDPTAARPREVAWRAGLLDQGVDAYVDAFVGRFFLHDADVATRLGDLTRARMRQTPEPRIAAQARALDTRRDMAPLLTGYAGPVEIVCGTEDKVCPAHLHRDLAGVLPRARLTEIADCGHISTLEAPDAVTAILKRIVTV